MTPEVYDRRRAQIVRESRLMSGFQASKDAYIAAQTAKLDLEAGKIAYLPQPKALAVPKSASTLKLEQMGDRWVGQCPACAEEGGDRTGNHLVVFEGGAFGCVKYPGDSGKDHRSKMAKLCPALRGGKGTWKPVKRVDLSKEEKALTKAYSQLWKAIKKQYSGVLKTLGESAPIPDEPKQQFLAWCSLWRPGQLAWCGTRYDWSESTRTKNPDRKYGAHRSFARHCFHPADEAEAEEMWDLICKEGLDHTSGAHWKSPEGGRDGSNLAGHRFLLVEHDGPKDKPTPPRHQVALLRYCAEVLCLRLVMVVSTAGKGFHGFFDAEPLSADTVSEVIKTLTALGADPDVLQRSSTRIPGAIRQPDPAKPDKPSGGVQSILWINPNL